MRCRTSVTFGRWREINKGLLSLDSRATAWRITNLRALDEYLRTVRTDRSPRRAAISRTPHLHGFAARASSKRNTGDVLARNDGTPGRRRRTVAYLGTARCAPAELFRIGMSRLLFRSSSPSFRNVAQRRVAWLASPHVVWPRWWARVCACAKAGA